MKKAFLLFVLPALLVTLTFAQNPASSSDTDQTTIKGCLGGSDGNYTVVEDNTGHIFKITSSTADLKPHLNHDITLIGHKTSGTGSPADNSLAVSEVKMISEHCAAAAAASTAPVTTPSETATTPAAPPAATAPAATVSALPETVSTPATDATASEHAATPATTATTPAADATPPAATATTPAATVTTPAADATPPVATITTPAETGVIPAEAATVKTPAKAASTPAAHSRKRTETPAAATTTPAVSASTPPESAVIPVATDTPSKEPVSTPAAVAPTPKPTPASNGWALWLLIAVGVVVLVGGVMFPFVSRWRKQKNLERTDAPNLSFNREASSAQNKSDQGTSDRKGPRKAA